MAFRITCLILLVISGCAYIPSRQTHAFDDTEAVLHLIRQSPASEGQPIAPVGDGIEPLLRRAGRPVDHDSDHRWRVSQSVSSDGSVMTRLRSQGRWESAQIKTVDGEYLPVSIENLGDDDGFLGYTLFEPQIVSEDLDVLFPPIEPELEPVEPVPEPEMAFESESAVATTQSVDELLVEDDLARRELAMIEALNASNDGTAPLAPREIEALLYALEEGRIIDVPGQEVSTGVDQTPMIDMEGIPDDAEMVSALDGDTAASVVLMDAPAVEALVEPVEETPLVEALVVVSEPQTLDEGVELEVASLDVPMDTMPMEVVVEPVPECAHVLNPPSLRNAVEELLACYGGYRLAQPDRGQPPDYRLPEPIDLTDFDRETVFELLDDHYGLKVWEVP